VIDSLGVGHCLALQLLLNDKYKLESLQEDGSRTRQEIPQTASCKARAYNCCCDFVTDDKSGKSSIHFLVPGPPLALEFGSFLACVWTRFGPLAREVALATLALHLS